MIKLRFFAGVLLRKWYMFLVDNLATMSTKYWKCIHCGLSNYLSASKCIACFIAQSKENTLPSLKYFEWIKLDDPPSYMQQGSITPIGSYQFMLATYDASDPCIDETIIPGLYLFDTRTNEWELWLEYPREWGMMYHHTLMFDTKRNNLYLWHRNEWMYSTKHTPKALQTINVNTGQYKTIANTSGVDEEWAVNLRDEIHFIGGCRGRHIKFDKNTEKFEQIHKFDEFDDSDYMSCPWMVYIESKQVILACFSYQRTNFDVREFSLKTGKWRKIKNIEYKYHGRNVLLTKDEKHILLMPNWNNVDGEIRENYYSMILIMDILNDGVYKLRKSVISMPQPLVEKPSHYSKNTVLMEDWCGNLNQVLVSGFVREMFDDDGWIRISEDILNMIVIYCESEILHVITRTRVGKEVNNHWIIDVSSILQ